ncbi:MAG: FAD-dependent monooxygenase [Ottowia sp.]|uniref:FAD-dependent monooxygenase n=1 Tax=Ottowia sp. TaxID=1898956 RepID=UPI003C793C7D
MHQPNIQPHPSSYFPYEIYPFMRPADMEASAAARHAVVIVGAGPVGLVLAIQLALQGVKPVLIEAEAQVSGGSRALALTRRSMEIMEQCGVVPQFLTEAIVWNEGRSYFRHTVVHHLEIASCDDDKHAPMTNLAQCWIEKFLVDRARALGVDLRFQTRLEALETGPEGVTLTLDTPEGEYVIEAGWVAACDGARSATRRLQNLRFEGQSFESRFVIADFNISLDEPPGRRCYFEPPWLPGHAALLHKAPRGVWRLDYQIPEGISDDEALDEARIRSHIQAHLDYIGVDLPWTLEWTTLYKPNTLTLARYNHGRVMYCGDAAHLLPVFGVRGLNTGIQDAVNLAWKLAAVVQGHARAELLDTFSGERVADAKQICFEAARSTRMMAPPTRGFRILQQAVLSLSLENEFTRGLLHWRTSHPMDYAGSPLSCPDVEGQGFSDGPTPGAPPRNVRLQQVSGSAKGWLLDAVRPAFNVLVFGDDMRMWAHALEDVCAARERGLNVQLIAVRTDSVRPPGADAVVEDGAGRAHALWGADDGAVYVLRPDLHVGARWKVGADTRVARVLGQLLLHQLRVAEPVYD